MRPSKRCEWVAKRSISPVSDDREDCPSDLLSKAGQTAPRKDDSVSRHVAGIQQDMRRQFLMALKTFSSIGGGHGMNRALIFTLLLFAALTVFGEEIVELRNGSKVLLLDDFTWVYVDDSQPEYDYESITDNQIPDFLRGGIEASAETIKIAVEMYLGGWRYTMPRPKSAQARWGNTDRRTTWHNGHWHNSQTDLYSSEIPSKVGNTYIGDRQDHSGTWRNGGSPTPPTDIEWLLSKDRGVEPE
jgi:hypothetical protein